MPPQELSFGDWNTDTATSTNINIIGDTFKLDTAIPDSVVNLYKFEDDSDTSVAVDSVGSNDLALNGGVAYQSDSAVGSLATYYDGVDDEGVSQSTVDLVASGSETAASLGGWVKDDANASGGGNPIPISWMAGDDAAIFIYVPDDTWEVQIRTPGGTQSCDSGVSVATSYQHVVGVVDTSEIEVWVDNTLQNTVSHSLDITTIGSGSIKTGSGPFGNYFGGWVDDLAISDQRFSSGDIDSLYNR